MRVSVEFAVRVLVTSDWHLDWLTLGVRRFEDLRDAVMTTVADAIERRVDAYCFLGDLCDPDHGPSIVSSLGVAIQAALILARERIRSYWVAGNHDVIEDGRGFSVLHAMGGLDALVRVYERPSLDRAMIGGKHVDVLALPYTPSSHDYSPADYVAKVTAGEGNKKADLTLVLGHLHVEGVVPGEETTEMARGRDVVFPLAGASALRRPVMFNGHYHQSQRTPGGVYIPGSLARLTMGEVGNAPCYLVMEV
jgi:DNA repair exonuclease SbcCD nuclease subunit